MTELSRRDFLGLSGKAVASLLLPPRVLDILSGIKETPPSSETNPVLSSEQAQLLREVSLRYVAKDYPRAVEIARSIDFIRNSEIEDPSNICGPLSIAILRDANLLANPTDIADFWLPNPLLPANTLFEKAFPKSIYDWIVVEESIDKVDFKQFPLLAGDVVFLRSGARGSFGHMLVVTGKGEEGEAYSVTNVNSPEGFIIDEVALYNPGRPGQGQFYDWTNPAKEKLGLTGFGGFFLWRLRYN